MTPPRDWDAGTYARVSDPQFEWALEVLDRLPLRGDETVLDAGCGSGRVTVELQKRLPAGHVFAVDASPSMVDKARETLDPDRATVWVADLLELEVPAPVDAVLSTATLHWILDHDRLFRRLYGVMKPGASIVAQCGGARNIDRFLALVDGLAGDAPYDEYFEGMDRGWYFPTPAQAARSAGRAGFVDVEAWLQEKPLSMPEPREFVRAVCLGHHLERLPDDLREPFVDLVCERAGSPLVLDYVRLNLDARKPA